MSEDIAQAAPVEVPSTPVATPEAKLDLVSVAETGGKLPGIPEPSAEELKVRLAEYEAKIKALEDKYSVAEEEMSLYRPKKELLSEVDGLSEKALRALKSKDLWSIVDEIGLDNDALLEHIAKGRPELSVEERVRKEHERIKADEERRVKAERESSYRKHKESTVGQLASWLDRSEVEADLAEAHELLRVAREEKDLPVEETIFSLVEKSEGKLSYVDAAKALADVFKQKVLKYSSIKSLDSELAKRYKKDETRPEAAKPSEPAKIQEKEVIKTLEAKIEDSPAASKLDDEFDPDTASIDEVMARIKKSANRKQRFF